MDIPANLGPDGTDLWTSITDYYELTPGEYRLLADACIEADLIAAMTADWVDNGCPMTTKGSMGQIVAHPYLGEVRQHRTTLRQLIVSMKLPHPEDEEEPAKLTRSQVGRIGGQAKAGHKGVRLNGAG